MKPRIKIFRLPDGIWWKCEGELPLGDAWGYGPTPEIAYQRWAEYWDIPF